MRQTEIGEDDTLQTHGASESERASLRGRVTVRERHSGGE